MTRGSSAPLRTALERFVPDAAKRSVREALARMLEPRVVTYRQLMVRDDVTTHWYGSSRTYEFGEPNYYNELPAEIERLLGRHECHQPFVLEVPDVELFGPHGYKTTPDGRYVVYNVMRDGSRTAARELAYEVVDSAADGALPVPARRDTEISTEFDVAVPLLHRWATNYSHWTEEWLAQLEGLNSYVGSTGRSPTIIVPSDPPAFVRRSLEVLGFADDVVEWTHGRARVERMVLPSIRRCQSGTSDDYIRDPGALQWLRDAVLGSIPPAGDDKYPSRILISREEDASERRIVNWAAVESRLSQLGFETVVLTELDFVEQKHRFAGAELIVGTHGAGLTELVYAPDAAVIELFGDYFVPVYYEMAQGFGMPYGCLRCPSVGDDLYVDVDRLVAMVDAMVERENLGTGK